MNRFPAHAVIAITLILSVVACRPSSTSTHSPGARISFSMSGPAGEVEFVNTTAFDVLVMIDGKRARVGAGSSHRFTGLSPISKTDVRIIPKPSGRPLPLYLSNLSTSPTGSVATIH
ncbi:hypothetical protein [Haloferula sp.]|uniref:hypothetical protein n=1 Tax=Haloferula sp. TaxID=2497595 RepID=UPI00329B31D8